MTRLAAYALALAGVLAAIAAVYFVGEARGAAHVQARFDAFTLTQAALARAQEADNRELAAERDQLRHNLEDVSAKAIPAIHARYDLELRGLRDQLSAGAGGVPAVTATPVLCVNAPDNDRLLEPIRQFRIGVRELLEQCQLQAQTLTTCQDWIRGAS